MQRNGAQKQSGKNSILLLPNSYVLPDLPSQLSVFSKLFIMSILLLRQWLRFLGVISDIKNPTCMTLKPHTTERTRYIIWHYWAD